MIYYFTSITKSYLPKARVCARSLKQFHPDCRFMVMFSDTPPAGFDLADEPFDEVLTVADLDIDDRKRWLFKHTVVELCTAVKGPVLRRLLERPDAEAVVYLDPDVVLYNDLGLLHDWLRDHDVLLTPHLLHPEYELELIRGNEIVTTLAHGIYNLGFLAVADRDQGRAFAQWWERRLLHFCYDDVPSGLFTDQRWCDFVPALFDRHRIIRDPGFNVATWNIRYRPVARDAEGRYTAGGRPLRFYHFTGFDAGFNFTLLQQFAGDQPAAFELWEDYGMRLEREGHGSPELDHWAYACYENGVTIGPGERRTYRQRPDLQRRFPDPCSLAGDDTYFGWYRQHGEEDLSGRARQLAADLEQARTELEQVYLSRSWRITSPLRALSTLVRGARRS